MSNTPITPDPPDTLVVSTDDSLLDLDVIHSFLSASYWSPGIARERLERAIRNSLNFGVYDRARPRVSDPAKASQVGFARVVTDRATYAYLCDVFVLESHRGRGASKRLMRAVLDHPELRGLRRFCLMTRDAHGLYGQFGFGPTPDPSRYMERLDRESYKLP
ncbi:MAG: GNAT family N-acetyltransferase [Phycisphaerae bacterium]|nr:GNAT family N-acetyltransferase [Phycisphaerae bacterium]